MARKTLSDGLRACAAFPRSAKNYYISEGPRQVQRSWASIRIGRRWELNLPTVKAIYFRLRRDSTGGEGRERGNKNCVVCLQMLPRQEAN